jgi:hypothetical protein
VRHKFEGNLKLGQQNLLKSNVVLMGNFNVRNPVVFTVQDQTQS